MKNLESKILEVVRDFNYKKSFSAVIEKKYQAFNCKANVYEIKEKDKVKVKRIYIRANLTTRTKFSSCYGNVFEFDLLTNEIKFIYQDEFKVRKEKDLVGELITRVLNVIQDKEEENKELELTTIEADVVNEAEKIVYDLYNKGYSLMTIKEEQDYYTTKKAVFELLEDRIIVDVNELFNDENNIKIIAEKRGIAQKDVINIVKERLEERVKKDENTNLSNKYGITKKYAKEILA